MQALSYTLMNGSNWLKDINVWLLTIGTELWLPVVGMETCV